MSVQLKNVPLTSDEILKELVIDSLPNILGEPFELITDNLPFEGNQILALNAEQRPTVISYDSRDGGRALLAGLGAIESLSDNRAVLLRLYPALFRGQRNNSSSGIFRLEEVRLVVLSPKAPPGGAYLRHAFRALTTFTFRTLEVEGNIGLLIEPEQYPAPGAGGDLLSTLPRSAPRPAFRSGSAPLSPEEESYFQ